MGGNISMGNSMHAWTWLSMPKSNSLLLKTWLQDFHHRVGLSRDPSSKSADYNYLAKNMAISQLDTDMKTKSTDRIPSRW